MFSVLALAACVTPIHPRSAEVAAPGELGWSAHVPLTTVAPGRVEGVGIEDPALPNAFTATGNTGPLGDGTAATILPLWWELGGSVGVLPGVEVGVFLGLLRLGAEARWQVLAQREGHGVSAALAAAGGFLPAWERNGAWWRGGVDLSRRFGDLGGTLNLYATRGVEGHRLELGTPPARIGYTPPDPDHSYDGEAIPYIQIAREETRVAAALGFSVQSAEGFEVIFGLVPYVVVDAGPVTGSRCGACDALRVTGFEERWGASLTLGFSAAPASSSPTSPSTPQPQPGKEPVSDP